MFKIGEFSKIAQVSGSLLRYYDSIGLFKPQHIEQESGYRYYTAGQLPRLNRILALKELGLPLDHIGQLLEHDIGTEEIRRLYLAHKAQLEHSLREELARLQQVQVRLQQLDSHEADWMPDVVLKRVPAHPYLSYRNTQMTGERLYQLFEALSHKIADASAEKSRYGSLLTVLYSDLFTPEAEMDLEIGVLLGTARTEPLRLVDGTQLTVRELPAIELMATIVHQGLDDHPLTYNALGRWLERHQYGIVGPGRERLLEAYAPDQPETCFMEIAFPVQRINAAASDVLSSLS